ncbi:MAG: hypothetical protein ACRC1K_16060 [Planctomycetia bacterium]
MIWLAYVPWNKDLPEGKMLVKMVDQLAEPLAICTSVACFVLLWVLYESRRPFVEVRLRRADWTHVIHLAALIGFTGYWYWPIEGWAPRLLIASSCLLLWFIVARSHRLSFCGTGVLLRWRWTSWKEIPEAVLGDDGVLHLEVMVSGRLWPMTFSIPEEQRDAVAAIIAERTGRPVSRLTPAEAVEPFTSERLRLILGAFLCSLPLLHSVAHLVFRFRIVHYSFFGLVFVAFPFGFHLIQRAWAGRKLIDLGPHPLRWLLFIALAAFVATSFLPRLDPPNAPPAGNERLLAWFETIYLLASLSAANMLYFAAGRVEFCERGLYRYRELFAWSMMTDPVMDDAGVLRFEAGGTGVFQNRIIEIQIPSAHRGQVAALLAERCETWRDLPPAPPTGMAVQRYLARLETPEPR